MSYNNGGSKAVSGGGITSIEFDSGITISGSNRVLLAFLFTSGGSPTAWTNCRWGGSGGTAMTDFGTTYGTGTNYLRGRAFSLKDASIGGSSLTVYASGSAIDEVGIAGVGYTDIDQTDSWRTPSFTENEGAPYSSISTTVTSASGETVVGANYHAAASVQAPADEAGDQTRRQTATASAYVSLAVSDMAGDTSVSFGFTFSDGHEYGAVNVVVPLKPAAAGDATATGVTLSSTSSVIAGTAEAQGVAQGVTLTSTGSLIAGTAEGSSPDTRVLRSRRVWVEDTSPLWMEEWSVRRSAVCSRGAVIPTLSSPTVTSVYPTRWTPQVDAT